MDLSIHVYHHFPADPSLAARVGKLETHMSALSDAIKADNDAADALLARLAAEAKANADKLAALQAQVDAGLATPEDLQALADLKVKLDAANPASPVTTADVPPPVVRSPDPEPMPG